MLGYLFKRIVQMLFSLAVLASVVFFMFRLMPGNPTLAMVDPAITGEARQALLERYGLNDSIFKQYLIFMKDLLVLDFGSSFHYKRSVLDVLGDKLIATLILMLFSMIIAYSLGIVFGGWLAWKRGSLFEALAITFTLIFRSAPTFWVGIMFIYLFSFQLGWFPHSGIRSTGYEAENLFQVYLTWDFLHHLILPAIVASLYFLATPLLMMRNTMLEVLGEDYIEMARAKGLKERQILYKHAVRNAMLPVVTTGALFLGTVIGGQVLIEYVFAWPGLGQEIILAAQRHDYPLAQASFIIMAAMVMIMNLIADILYGYLDPRITYK